MVLLVILLKPTRSYYRYPHISNNDISGYLLCFQQPLLASSYLTFLYHYTTLHTLLSTYPAPSPSAYIEHFLAIDGASLTLVMIAPALPCLLRLPTLLPLLNYQPTHSQLQKYSELFDLKMKLNCHNIFVSYSKEGKSCKFDSVQINCVLNPIFLHFTILHPMVITIGWNEKKKLNTKMNNDYTVL